MIERRLGKWLPLVFAVMTAFDGWLASGSLAQATVIAVAVFKRLRGKVRAAAGGANDLA